MTVSYLTWESPYLGKMVFILRQGPGFCGIPVPRTMVFILNQAPDIMAENNASRSGTSDTFQYKDVILSV